MALRVDQSKEDISNCKGKGTLPWQQVLVKIGKNLTKMAITSVLCDTSMQSLALR